MMKITLSQLKRLLKEQEHVMYASSDEEDNELRQKFFARSDVGEQESYRKRVANFRKILNEDPEIVDPVMIASMPWDPP